MAKITEAQHQEKAVFVGVIKQGDDERQIMEYLDELEFLAETAGAIGVKKFIQKVDRPDSRTYIRSGKLIEIKEYCEENDIEVVIFDDELSPTQLRNIERELNIRIHDRTNLILDYTSVSLDLCLTGTTHTDTSLLSLQVSPHSS